MSTLTSLDHLVKRHQSAVVTSSPEYKANLEEWQGLIEQLQERLQEATNEGKEKHIALHKKRGQLPGMFGFTLSRSASPHNFIKGEFHICQHANESSCCLMKTRHSLNYVRLLDTIKMT